MKRGFTLIELAVTLLVISVAVGISAPSIARGPRCTPSRRPAREQAITHSRSYEVRVKAEEGVIELRTGDAVRSTRRMASGVHIAADPPSAPVVTFLPQGVTSGGRLRVEMPGRRGYLITLDALTGRVSTQRLEL